MTELICKIDIRRKDITLSKILSQIVNCCNLHLTFDAPTKQRLGVTITFSLQFGKNYMNYMKMI